MICPIPVGIASGVKVVIVHVDFVIEGVFGSFTSNFEGLISEWIRWEWMGMVPCLAVQPRLRIDKK